MPASSGTPSGHKQSDRSEPRHRLTDPVPQLKLVEDEGRGERSDPEYANSGYLSECLTEREQVRCSNLPPSVGR